MIGAGVFSAFAPAAQAAGSWLLLGLVIAAVVAFCNATSSAQLAAEFPEAGGTYVYGRRMLGDWWGFAAGWSFVIGKTASCAAMALTFAAYAAPTGWEKPIAVVAVVGLVTVNLFGVTRTALLARVIVVIVLVALAIAVAAASHDGLPSVTDSTATSPYGVLQSAGILFFAFAGYARIATMGEEVRDPARTIPRAITISLLAAIAVYGVIAVVVLGTLGPTATAASSAPLADAVASGGWHWAEPVVRVGAAAASLGALLSLIAGIGRTSFAMARGGDLPTWLAAVHPRFGVPHRAELVLGAVVIAVVLVADLRGAIAFSSFGVLLYYFVANLAAYRQRHQRRYPRALQVIGAAACLALVVTLPVAGIAAGVLVLALGLLFRAVRLRTTV